MSTFALVGSGAPLPPNGTLAAGKLQLQVEDALASVRRLWIRGQVRNLIPPPDRLPSKRRWWSRWKKNGHPNGQLPAGALPEKVHLEARVSGAAWETDIALPADGRFDALFTVDFPQDRPGWRTARYRLSAGPQIAEACGVVLRPVTAGNKATVVFLPIEYTYSSTEVQQLVNPKWAPRLNEILQSVAPDRETHAPVFYLAAIPPSGGSSSTELALAATALGWPGGDFVLLAAERGREVPALAEGLERLRWLFADSLELELLNLESTVTPSLFSLAADRSDRATIRFLANPEEMNSRGGHRLRLSYNRIISLRPSRAGLVPRHPVVFCHGMLAFSMPAESAELPSMSSELKFSGKAVSASRRLPPCCRADTSFGLMSSVVPISADPPADGVSCLPPEQAVRVRPAAKPILRAATAKRRIFMPRDVTCDSVPVEELRQATGGCSRAADS